MLVARLCFIMQETILAIAGIFHMRPFAHNYNEEFDHLYCRGHIPGGCKHLLCRSLHGDIQGQVGAGLEGALPGSWGPCL